LIQESTNLASAPAVDLVVLVITGDLLEPEYQFLQELQRQQRRSLVVWNKRDQYLSADQQLVFQTLHERLRGLVPQADILAVSAAPLPIQVRHHDVDGAIRQWQEQPAPHITPLLERLVQISTQEANQLVVHQTWQQAQALQSQTQSVLNQARRDCAQPILERYQWLAAATAFASPLPALDLLGVGLLTGKLVQELAALYQQPLSLEQARQLATTLGGLMLKLGLVEFATQSLGSILKGSGITYLLGAAVQGASTAYLTRLAGLTLVEYFQAQSEAHPGTGDLPQQLRRHLNRILQTQRHPEVLQNLVNQVLPRLPAGETPLPLPLLVKPAEPIVENESYVARHCC
jgi:uncharacterized protein